MSPTPGSATADLQQTVAELQRQLTEARAERDESEAQKAAIAEVLGVINSSPGDLAPVFDAMLKKATSLCDASFGVLWTYDGEYMHASAITGVPPQFADFLKQGPHRPARTMQQDLLCGRPFGQIPDLTKTEGYQSGETLPRAGADLGGVRTLLGITLRKDDRVLGIFGIYRQEVRLFSEKQIALLQNFAAQAVIAMENARLITETREALEQQTATAEVLGVINASPGDLASVFDAMLEKAMRLCEAAFGQLWTYDDSWFEMVTSRGVPPDYAEFLKGRHRPGPGTVHGRVAAGEDLVHIADIANDEVYRAGDPHRKRTVELGGARSMLAASLRRNEKLLGVLTIYRQEVRPFTDKQIALVQNFAAQAVIAMENARLITETREALEQQTATAEVLGVINSSPGDLAPVFDAMLDRALRLCGGAYGTLLTFDGEQFLTAATRGDTRFTDWAWQRGPFEAPPGGPLHRSVKGEDLVEITDLLEHQQTRQSPFIHRLVELGGYRSLLNVALRKGSAFFGVIAIYRKEVRPFSDKQIALLQNFAAQAVIAIENARLITETREALEQQTATAEVLGVINASPSNLGPVFDAMLERATRLCEASSGLMWTTIGERFQAVAIRGMSPEFVEFIHDPDNQPRMVASNLPIGRVVRGEPLVHVLDLMAGELTHEPPEVQKVVELGGFRTILALPLRNEAALLGIFVVGRREVRPFTDRQIALLQNFAAQAVIAMENARLITETREALEQQTATAEVLSVINTSPGDLTPVFDAILERALHLCEAQCGNITIFDGETFNFVAAAGHAEFDEWIRLSAPARPGPGTTMERMIRGERVVHIADIADDEVYRAGSPIRVALVEIGGFHTFLGVALRKDDVLLGILHIYRQQVRPFSEKQIALLQNFAAQAVIAMENARLITETREALEQQTATAEVLQVINTSPGDLTPVFSAMLEKALRLCGAAYGNFLSYDGECFQVLATTHDRPGYRFKTPPGSALDQILKGENVVSIDDLASSNFYRFVASPHFRQLVETGGYRSLLNVALRKDGALLGVMVIFDTQVRPFTDKQIALVQNFAAQAVIAMENARLLGELRHRTDEVAELNRGLEARVAEQVDELGRVGRLKRFLAPQLAELIVSQGDEKILESHRREIVVVFCDLRGYTAFTETAEPEEVLDFLREYHGALGPLVSQFEGTLDQFSGDGIMVFFNDPVPIPDPAERAVKMAVAMREAAGTLISRWRERGRDLGFGAGIAQGYATLGPDRIFRTLRLHRNRHRVQYRRPSLCRGKGRPNSARSTRQRRTERKRRN